MNILDGIPALVKLLQSERSDIQSVAASVLCNISEEGMCCGYLHLLPALFDVRCTLCQTDMENEFSLKINAILQNYNACAGYKLPLKSFVQLHTKTDYL